MNIRRSVRVALISSLALSFGFAGDVYGTVNGEPITKEELKQVVGPMASNIDGMDKSTKDKIINMLVERKLLIQNALKSGIENNDTYKKKLKVLKRELALTLWMEQEAKKIESSTTDAELKDFYNKNRDRFKTPPQLKARHILVKTKEEAEEIIKKLSDAKDIKAEFIKLAKEKSIGPSGKDGGDLGWFPLNRMVPEFSKSASKLKKGEFTKEPVKTQFGYHVIYLEDKKPESIKSFDEVKPQIKALVNRKKFNDLIESTVKNLKKSAKIELK